MTELNEFEKMVRLLDAAWPARDQIVPCLVGPPGIGKTAAVMQHARTHGCGKVVKIVASRCVPSETVGMTMPDNEHRSMEIYNSTQLSSLEDGDILFLDELLEADQFVLSTLLTVIESREMADGTPLPDIQIVAATNDTISPEQLRGNIRQRFMFQRFYIDLNAVRNYVFDQCGIEVPYVVLKKLCTDGNDYNFLTPRSLTKLCLWIDRARESELSRTAEVINDIWKSSIGTVLMKARIERDQKVDSPEEQLRKALREIVPDIMDEFKDCTMTELLDILQSQDDWDDIASKLAGLQVKEANQEEPDIKF